MDLSDCKNLIDTLSQTVGVSIVTSAVGVNPEALPLVRGKELADLINTMPNDLLKTVYVYALSHAVKNMMLGRVIGNYEKTLGVIFEAARAHSVELGLDVSRFNGVATTVRLHIREEIEAVQNGQSPPGMVERAVNTLKIIAQKSLLFVIILTIFMFFTALSHVYGAIGHDAESKQAGIIVTIKPVLEGFKRVPTTVSSRLAAVSAAETGRPLEIAYEEDPQTLEDVAHMFRGSIDDTTTLLPHSGVNASRRSRRSPPRSIGRLGFVPELKAVTAVATVGRQNAPPSPPRPSRLSSWIPSLFRSADTVTDRRRERKHTRRVYSTAVVDSAAVPFESGNEVELLTIDKSTNTFTSVPAVYNTETYVLNRLALMTSEVSSVRRRDSESRPVLVIVYKGFTLTIPQSEAIEGISAEQIAAVVAREIDRVSSESFGTVVSPAQALIEDIDPPGPLSSAGERSDYYRRARSIAITEQVAMSIRNSLTSRMRRIPVVREFGFLAEIFFSSKGDTHDISRHTLLARNAELEARIITHFMDFIQDAVKRQRPIPEALELLAREGVKLQKQRKYGLDRLKTASDVIGAAVSVGAILAFMSFAGQVTVDIATFMASLSRVFVNPIGALAAVANVMAQPLVHAPHVAVALLYYHRGVIGDTLAAYLSPLAVIVPILQCFAFAAKGAVSVLPTGLAPDDSWVKFPFYAIRQMVEATEGIFDPLVRGKWEHVFIAMIIASIGYIKLFYLLIRMIQWTIKKTVRKTAVATVATQSRVRSRSPPSPSRAMSIGSATPHKRTSSATRRASRVRSRSPSRLPPPPPPPPPRAMTIGSATPYKRTSSATRQTTAALPQ